jgi:hypothetical protein
MTSMSSNQGNMETTFELIVTMLPYYRYFFSASQHNVWSNELKGCLQSICQQSAHSPNNQTIEEDENEMPEGIDHKLHKEDISLTVQHPRPRNHFKSRVHSQNNLSSAASIREVDIEEIESFSD